MDSAMRREQIHGLRQDTNGNRIFLVMKIQPMRDGDGQSAGKHERRFRPVQSCNTAGIRRLVMRPQKLRAQNHARASSQQR